MYKRQAEKAVKVAQNKKISTPVHEFQSDVEAVITEVENRLGNSVPEEQKRFFAIKLLERDDKIKAQMTSAPDVSAEISELENKMDDDTESIITN